MCVFPALTSTPWVRPSADVLEWLQSEREEYGLKLQLAKRTNHGLVKKDLAKIQEQMNTIQGQWEREKLRKQQEEKEQHIRDVASIRRRDSILQEITAQQEQAEHKQQHNTQQAHTQQQHRTREADEEEEEEEDDREAGPYKYSAAVARLHTAPAGSRPLDPSSQASYAAPRPVSRASPVPPVGVSFPSVAVGAPRRTAPPPVSSHPHPHPHHPPQHYTAAQQYYAQQAEQRQRRQPHTQAF